jgi:hypothetical protein
MILRFFLLPQYNSRMLDAKQNLDQYFLEMRWRCLSLAADLDRIQRGEGSAKIKDDIRLSTLRRAIGVLLEDSAGRAERVQMLLSDASPPPIK